MCLVYLLSIVLYGPILINCPLLNLLNYKMNLSAFFSLLLIHFMANVLASESSNTLF